MPNDKSVEPIGPKIIILNSNLNAMKTFEIKKKLIEEINLSDNSELLEEFYRFLNLENEIQEIYKLSEEQNTAIAEARNQIKLGNCLTNKQANQEIDKWLEE